MNDAQVKKNGYIPTQPNSCPSLNGVFRYYV
jgi:hypothetical protein